jgi:hypothetical protein
VKVSRAGSSNREVNNKGLPLCQSKDNNHNRVSNNHRNSHKGNSNRVMNNKELRHCQNRDNRLKKHSNNHSRVGNNHRNSHKENSNLEIEQMVQALVSHRGSLHPHLKGIPDLKIPLNPEPSHQHNHLQGKLNLHLRNNPNPPVGQRNPIPLVKEEVHHNRIEPYRNRLTVLMVEADLADLSNFERTFYL